MESLQTEPIPAPEVAGPFVDSVESEVPVREHIEPFVMQDEAESESAAPAKKTAPAKKAAKKS